MKILLVDDHPLILAALRPVIQGLRQDAEVVGVDNAADARAALVADADFDLVLLDLSLGADDGFALLGEFRQSHPALPVVVMSASERSADVIRAVDLGCMGYIPKRLSNLGLRDALNMVMSGGLYMPPGMLALFGDGGACGVAGQRPSSAIAPESSSLPVSALLAPLGAHARPEPHQAAQRRLEDMGLTPRQSQVLTLLLQGLPNKLIARQLNLSVETVKDHVAAVLRALGVGSRTQAVLVVGQMAQGHANPLGGPVGHAR